jgi:hypothetical protein
MLTKQQHGTWKHKRPLKQEQTTPIKDKHLSSRKSAEKGKLLQPKVCRNVHTESA